MKTVLHGDDCATWEALLSAMISLESENILKEGVIITERWGLTCHEKNSVFLAYTNIV